MKSLLISMIAGLLFVSFYSCNKDFLDRPDLDNITTSSFWKTPSDLELYVTQFYHNLPSWSPGAWNGGIYWWDGSSDNLIHTNVNNRMAGLYTINSGNGNWDYGDIRSVNIFLDKYPEVDAPMSEIGQSVGEGYFFRAWFYFDLLRNYGGVPWIEKPLAPDAEELFAPRESRDVIATKILEDLDQAISFLNSGKQANGNRISKEVAMLFKARVALYEGTWEKYHAGTEFGVSGKDGSNFIQMAADVAKNLMDNPAGFAISTNGDPQNDYWTLFNQTDLSSNPEVMVWRKFDLNQGVTHNGQRYLPRIGGSYGLSRQLVNDYLCSDGKPIATSPLYQGDATIMDVSANRDLRLSQTMWLPGELMATGRGQEDQFFEKAPIDASGSSRCPTGYMIYKGANPNRDHFFTGGVGTTTSPAFRFAEALLIYAEAKAELGTITQSDLDMTVNVLRDRVAMPHLIMAEIETDPNWLYPNLSPILNEVRRERHIEFALEGYRPDDIMRWRAHDLFVGKRLKGAKFDPETYPDVTVGEVVFLDEEGYIDPLQKQIPNGYQFNPGRDYLLPVPQEQLTLNTSFTQNPGWN